MAISYPSRADVPDVSPFDGLTLAQLQTRRSAKWTAYPADVLPAWIAEMDFPLAPAVRAALTTAVERDDCGYVGASLPDFGQAAAAYARDRLCWELDPRRVVPVSDVMVGVAELLRRVAPPGAGVVINPPVYPPFFSVVDEVGCRVVEVPLARGDDGAYALDLAGLERAFAGGARVYLLCNPHNPTGRVFAEEELREVSRLAARHDVVVLSDEIHAPLVLPGARHVPYVGLGGEAARHGVTLLSASKGWNLAGLKAAALVTAPGPLGELVDAFPHELHYRTGHLGVLAAVAAWCDGGPWLDDVLATLDRNRGLLGTLLGQRLPQVRYRAPEASYLAWLDCRELGLGDDPAKRFLKQGRVALSSGPTFGRQGAGFARLNIATSAALLTEAVERMATAVG
ncbi:MAG: aminotransferase class I/II-fold pyridoxal phosphate-dependent enzyme [Actinomycetota bacterium]|nr:aminotransferase class I/II-fold pyridoxal phosphate-dependent enzyme [Actinomycetota bacterium]